MENFEKCTVAMLGGPCSQHVMGNTSRLNQPQSAIMLNTKGHSEVAEHYLEVSYMLYAMYDIVFSSLQWRHNRHNSVLNHQPHHCLLNRLFRCRSKKHQSSASLAFVWGIHRWPMKSPHKWPVTQQMLPFDDVIMILEGWRCDFIFLQCNRK